MNVSGGRQQVYPRTCVEAAREKERVGRPRTPFKQVIVGLRVHGTNIKYDLLRLICELYIIMMSCWA